MSNTINIHARFSGDVAETIEMIISRGRAASKTEAIRLALLDYRERHLEDKEIERFFRDATVESFNRAWDNPADEKAAEWYRKNAKRLAREAQKK
ncbi:MAG: hypothetical protein AB1657_06075 [Candidatus Micrarchaeota archaeon]